MAGTPTPNYGWPIPALTDPPDGPAQIGALGNAIDATMRGVSINWTPNLTSFTMGNGVLASAIYRKAGGLCWLHFRINAAASAPTTAFTSGATQVTNLPVTPAGISAGLAWFSSSGVSKIGQIIVVSGGTIADLSALRQSDVGLAPASSVWGTAPWPVGSVLQATLIYPI